MPALIIRSGARAGERLELDAELVVGRGQVDCVIDDAELSRRHLVVRVAPAGVEIEDLGSLNGTWYQGRRVERPTVIPGGGVIRIGETELEVELGGPPPEASRTLVRPSSPPPEVAPVAAVRPAEVAPVAAVRPAEVAPAAAVRPAEVAPVAAVRPAEVAPAAAVRPADADPNRRLVVPLLLALLAVFVAVIVLIVYLTTR